MSRVAASLRRPGQVPVEAALRGVQPMSEPPQSSSAPLTIGETVDEQPALPAFLGRYRVRALLGRGGFGVVYRGYDEGLRRDVAIKVPHRSVLSRPEDVEAYLEEARVLATLDHTNIVPVF